MSTKGFTIVELLIVIVVAGILTGILFGPMDDIYTSNTNGLRKIASVADSHSVLDSMENTIQLSGGFLSTNAVSDPSGTTWHSSNNGVNNVLITSNYATTVDENSDTSGTRVLALASDCSTQIKNNYVFFVSGTTLYRRTLKNTTGTCAGFSNGAKQTCAPGASSGSCQGVDAALADDVQSFTVDYYGSPESSTTISTPASASTVVLHVTVQNGTGNNAITSSNNLRVTHLN